MRAQHLSTAGIQFLKWYNMGITNAEDLAWCMKFYHDKVWAPSLVMGALTAARQYQVNRVFDERKFKKLLTS